MISYILADATQVLVVLQQPLIDGLVDVEEVGRSSSEPVLRGDHIA